MKLGPNPKTVNKWVQNLRRELTGGSDPKAEDRELREAFRRVVRHTERAVICEKQMDMKAMLE